MEKNITNIYIPFCIGDLKEFSFYKKEWNRRYKSLCIFFIDKRDTYENLLEQIFKKLKDNEIIATQIYLFPVKEIENEKDIDLILNDMKEFERTREEIEKKGINYILYLYPFLKIKDELLNKTLENIGDRKFFIFTDKKKDGTNYSRREWIDNIMDYLHLLSLREESNETNIHLQDILPVSHYITFTSEKAEFERALAIKKKLLLDLKEWLVKKVSRRQENPVMEFFFEAEANKLKNKLNDALIFPENFDQFQMVLISINLIDERIIKKGGDFLAEYEKGVIRAINEFEENDIKKFMHYIEENYNNFRRSYREFLRENETPDFIVWGVKNLKKYSLLEILDTLSKAFNDIKFGENREFPKFKIIEDIEKIFQGTKPSIEKLRKKLLKALKWFRPEYLFSLFLIFFLLLYILKSLHLLNKISLLISFSISLFITYLYRKKRISNLQKRLLNLYKELKERLFSRFKELSRAKFEKLKMVMFYPFILNFEEIYRTLIKRTVLHFDGLKENFIFIINNIDKILKEIDVAEYSQEINIDWYQFLGNGDKNSLFYLPWLIYSKEDIEFLIFPEVKDLFNRNKDNKIEYEFDEKRIMNSNCSMGALQEASCNIFIIKHPIYSGEVKSRTIRILSSIQDENVLGLKILFISKLERGVQS